MARRLMAEKRGPRVRTQHKNTKRHSFGAGCGWAASVATVGLLGAIAVNAPGAAAGIDSRLYSCAALQSLVASQGFVFISSPAFGDFVVANASYCSGGARVQLRSVPTADQPECLVNYCVPSTSMGSN
jgi:hypothetical protein